MALTGFLKTCSRRCGGVRAITLGQADQFSSITYDQSTQSYSNIRFSSQTMQSYEFQEDCASFVETSTLTEGSCQVEHRLSFALGKMDNTTRNAVDELIDASYGGLVAIVTTNNGDSFLVGLSEEFGPTRPLRMVKCAASTGEKPKDAIAMEVTLQSTDMAFARSYNYDSYPAST